MEHENTKNEHNEHLELKQECGCHEHKHEHHEHCEHEKHSHGSENHGHHHHHDHGCGCCCGHNHGHGHEHNHEGHSHEHGKELTTGRLIFAAILFVAGIITEHLTINYSIPGLKYSLKETLCIIFFCVSFIIVGKNIIINAIYNLFKGHLLDEGFLMSISSIGALILGKYEEAVAIMLLYQVGEKFEDYAVDKSRNSIEEISKLRPDVATLKQISSENEKIELTEVSPDDVKTGSIIIVKPGERIPIDGIITDGESFIDTSALTGESIPQKVRVGDEVLSGSINMQGVLEIQTTKHAQDSALSRILDLVENATENKTKSEQFVTRFAKVYTPIVVSAAAIVAVIPGIFIGLTSGDWSWNNNFSIWVYRALMFLVVSCPCALVISIPLSFCGGITACAKKGILIKGSTYLEALGNTKIAVFDKTGTLTKGNFVVSHIHATDDAITEDELLALATHTEMFSSHPISTSLKYAHHDKCCDEVKLENVEEITSKGIKAIVNGKEVLAGNTKLMNQFNIEYNECAEHQDGTIVHVACNGKYAGHIVISDEIKDDAEQTIAGLKKLGVSKTVMLTGDNQRSAEIVASKLSLDKVYAQLLSEDKLRIVEELHDELAQNNKKTGKKGTLIFTGDGINDAPVLARADAGIAMGTMGSDAAVESADIIIMEDKPSKIVEGIKISRRTLRIVYENLIGSLGIKGIILILSALGISNMWLAVFGDVGVTILAVLNCLRLFSKARGEK